MAQWHRIHLPSRRHRFHPWVRKIPPEKEIASHSSILTWEVPQTEEPGGLQSMGSHRGGHHSVARWRPQLLYDAVLVSAVQQSESAMHVYIHTHVYVPVSIYVYPLCFGFASSLGHQRAQGRVPCVTQKVLIIYFICSINGIYVSVPTSQFLHLALSLDIHTFVLYICLSTSALLCK